MNIQSFTPRTAKKLVKQDFILSGDNTEISLSSVILGSLIELMPSVPFGTDFREASVLYAEDGRSHPVLSTLFKIKSMSIRLTSVGSSGDKDVTIMDRKGFITFGSNSLKKNVSYKDTKYGQWQTLAEIMHFVTDTRGLDTLYGTYDPVFFSINTGLNEQVRVTVSTEVLIPVESFTL